MSSGRLRNSRLIGASTISTISPIVVQAVRQPLCSITYLHPGQQRHRADADAGKGNADRKAAAADEPVRQEQRLAGITETHAAGADHDADGEVEVPGLARQRREQQPAAHQRDAELHHRARTGAIHQPADQRD